MEKSLFKNLRIILYRYRWKYLAGFLMLAVSNLLLILNPLIFRQAVLFVDTRSEVEAGFISDTLKWVMGSYTGSIGAWTLLLITIALTSSFLKYWMRITFISVSRELEMQVRSRIFDRIQKQSMAFYDRHGIGELISRLTNDISSYRDILGPGIMYPLLFITIVTPGLIALFSISPKLATVSLFPLIAVPFMNSLIRGKIYKLAGSVQVVLADMSNMAQENFSAIRIVKGYVVESVFLKQFRALSRKMVGLNISLSAYQGLLFPFFVLLTKLTTVVLVMFAGAIIFKAWGELSSADFVSFMWIQSYIFFPVLMLGWLLPVYERGRASYDRLVEIYHEPIEVVDQAKGELSVPKQADIEFHNLSFKYPTAKTPTLKDITLTLKAGSFIGITGPIGSGKSTLFKLLQREYEIPKGMITIGGIDIHEYPLEAFHREMSTVEQVPFLFSKSIADNVLFGNREASKEELEIVARYADIHETVLEFPEQYATIIGERGVTLSGGQKQRIAMARAFLVNRSILLLDDIFSAVDSSTEKQIFEAMRVNFVGKTVILITHRVSILEKMDRVVYLDDGRVLEEGTPEELMKKNEHYAALVQLQQLDESQ